MIHDSGLMIDAWRMRRDDRPETSNGATSEKSMLTDEGRRGEEDHTRQSAASLSDIMSLQTRITKHES